MYLPVPDEGGKFIVGRIGKQLTVSENAPPKSKFEAVKRDTWIASLLVIDPSAHPDGQKLALEEKTGFAKSLPLVQSLCAYINDTAAAPYIIEANAITDVETFWDFERAHRGSIVSVSFYLTAPNMFGIRERIDTDMAELRDTEKVVSTVVTLKHPNGLQLETDRVRQTVAYAGEGGGSIKARARKKTFNSEKKIKTVTVIDENDVATETVSAMIGRAVTRLFGND